MGTRGYWAYRYGGWYFIHYNQYDSYPAGLGTKVINEVPRNPVRFSKWKAKLASQLQKALDIHEPEEDKEDSLYLISRDAPQNDLFIEWVYVIDIERNAFSVDNGAHFRLDNLPPGNEWIEGLGLDGRRHRCLATHVKSEHRADVSLPRPDPSSEFLQAYQEMSCECRTFDNPWEPSEEILALDLIDVKSCLLMESVRMINQGCPQEKIFYKPALSILSVFEKEGMSRKDMEIVNMSRGLMGWSKNRTFLLFATHLGHPDNFMATIAEAVKFMIIGSDRKSSLSGLVFSIMHVVRIKISFGDDGIMSVQHTSATPLLLDLITQDVSAAGISLLRQAFKRHRSFFVTEQSHRDHGTFVNFPTEIILHILSFADDVETLRTCTVLHSRLYSIAITLLDAPHFGSYRILKLLGSYRKDEVVAFNVCLTGERYVLYVVPGVLGSKMYRKYHKELKIVTKSADEGQVPLCGFVLSHEQYENKGMRAAFEKGEKRRGSTDDEVESEDESD